MQDFASAAMVRLLVRAMRAQGLNPPPPPPGLDGLQDSHVPLAYKRSVVEAVLHQGGLGTLLQLAQRVDLLAGDPVHRALLGATSVPELMARWQRLERYVHSRHQVSIKANTPGTLALHHHARPGVLEEPHPTESLAVLGVLMGAIHAMGVRGLQVDIGAPEAPGPRVNLRGNAPAPTPAELHAQLAPLAAQGQMGHWTLRWGMHQDAGKAPIAPALEPPPTHLCDALPWPPLAHRLARHVLCDPAAQHTVDALAEHAGLARRSLQRALSEGGLSCRHIVTEARARMAAQWLLDSPHGLAEIGFACGFADQPHFTREFARHVGLTPARYRQAFAGATVLPDR
ncbi:helix-turn-helix transcriptional regulator [Acidovorax sp.]|uniref:helix-turn-helix transcriptional regulator n=1 Tax=Acidovorax sp. TaxID=1872122 RepID=UPI002620662E|nr:helix-turn-helix transcriptional regulator [Acidovorax sp.]